MIITNNTKLKNSELFRVIEKAFKQIDETVLKDQTILSEGYAVSLRMCPLVGEYDKITVNDVVGGEK